MMEINGNEIRPGENKKIKIRVGKLPSGTHINIFANVYRAKKKGKTILILGGIHGDEINGVEIIRRSIEQEYYEDLISGTVIVIPLLNVYGFINFSREVPDGKDVNRSFPGVNTGSLASRVARKLTKFILPHVDFGIDFHTGGDSRYNYPQIRYSKGVSESKALAEVFNAPFMIEKPMIKKSLRKAAHDMGIPIIVFEGGESKRLDNFAIEKGLAGIKNILLHFDMIEPEKTKDTKSSIKINKTSWIRARESGLFRSLKESGYQVDNKELIGMIKDIMGEQSKNIHSNRNAYILGHNNAPVVNMGDALFNLGWYEEK